MIISKGFTIFIFTFGLEIAAFAAADLPYQGSFTANGQERSNPRSVRKAPVIEKLNISILPLMMMVAEIVFS